jgi:SAM-dependent methyltransferase
MIKYEKSFYINQRKKDLRVAEKMVPIVLRFIEPKKIIDVGCGVGHWLYTFRKHGINDVIGIDNEYVPEDKLLIPKDLFIVKDLEKNIKVDETFDLAVCLEVAEHLSKRRAKSFIKEVTALAPIVLFSAAIPGQGGTNHINERWQSYWVTLFKKNNYMMRDCIRSIIWDDKKIPFWYKQNMFFFVKSDELKNYSSFSKNYFSPFPVDIVHPDLYKKYKNYAGENEMQG